MRKALTAVIGLCILCLTTNAYALEGIEILAGFLDSEIMTHSNDWEIQPAEEDYQGIPLLVAFNFDAEPAFAKIGIKPAGRLNFVVEPFFNTLMEPNANVEFGTNFLIKYTFPLSKKVQPYFKVGTGLLYMTRDTQEQATKFNFASQAGAGIHYFLNDNLALSFEYRFRHLSNANIDTPNSGINADLFLGGVSFFFD